MQVNDCKTCRDHETSTLNHDFWICSTLIAHNSCIDGRNKVTSSPTSHTSSVRCNVVLALNQGNGNDGTATIKQANASVTTREAALDDVSFSAANSNNKQREDKDD
jgi:hypothetical protein